MSMKLKREGSAGLGATIRQKRHEKGMTVTTLAQESGVSQSYLSQIERGDVSNPSIEVVSRIFEALDEDLVLQAAKRETSSPALVYMSPFSLEELASMDEEYSGQQVVRLVQDVLKDPEILIQQRRLLGKQIEGLLTATKEEIKKRRDA